MPSGRTTVLEGGAGSGKTLFAFQFLLHGVQHCGEPGIFVAFEEEPIRIVANFQGLGLKVEDLKEADLYFLDARVSSDMVQSGEFDLGGLLSALEGQVVRMGAKRIVFDAIDVILAFLPDNATRKRQVYKLHEWLLSLGLTGLITAKSGGEGIRSEAHEALAFMHFMTDCSVVLNHRVSQGVSQRNLRVRKFRGSGFDENEAPFVIGNRGFDVARARTAFRGGVSVTNERVSSGVDRLDTMLGGGYYRGASILITGSPGTAKTTLSGAFVEAACRRGEPTTFFSFDSDANEVIRNLTSVGIQLGAYVESGLLRIVSARTISGSAETVLVHIKTQVKQHGSQCVVIDPVSTLARIGNELTAHGVAERLIDFSKSEGSTLLCTSLLDELSGVVDASTPLQISTISDTWIHLSYLVQAGERNRGLSIIKSRGTAHSNQVRELILSDEGVTLADIYTAGGEVLMGTMRWEKESAERLKNEVASVAERLKLVGLEAAEAVLEVRIKSLQTELIAKQVERELLTRNAGSREGEVAIMSERMSELRGSDETVSKEGDSS